MKKRTLHLDAEEQEIVDAFERGEFRSVPNLKAEIKKHQAYARNTLRRMQKDKRVNIRISSGDLMGIQGRALAEGLPYQTLMSSVLHKFITGQLAEKR